MKEKFREIKFRGKRFDNGVWVYGYYVYAEDAPWIYDEKGNRYFVGKYTVCQYTGLKDKNECEIFEGDIIRFRDSLDDIVEFRHCAFGYDGIESFIALAGNRNLTFNPYNTDKDFEVIGNKFDNPELLD